MSSVKLVELVENENKFKSLFEKCNFQTDKIKNNCKSSCTKARKHLLEISKLCKQQRKCISEYKQTIPIKKKKIVTNKQQV
jgi:uncharacterized protein YdcH (DUF465 family)